MRLLSCIIENFSDDDEESMLEPEEVALAIGDIVVAVLRGFVVAGLLRFGVVLASLSRRKS